MPAMMAIPPPDHLWFLGSAPLDAQRARELTGRSTRTLARQAAAGWPDRAVLAVLQAAAFGVLPHPAWREWRLDRDGFLCYWRPSRGLGAVSVADLHQRHALALELSTLRGIIARLQADLEAARRVEPEQLALRLVG